MQQYKKTIIIGIIFILLLVGIGLIYFQKEGEKSSDSSVMQVEDYSEITTEEEMGEEEKIANNKILLEYCAEHFDVQTRALFSDLTHDGLEELLVYDDVYDRLKIEKGIIMTLCIFSVIDDQVVEIDEIDKSVFEDLYLYEEENKWYFVEQTGDYDVFESPGKVCFCLFYYDKEGKRQNIEEETFITDLEKENWTKEINNKADAYKEKVTDYICNSKYALNVGFQPQDMGLSSEELPPSEIPLLQELCAQYGIEVSTEVVDDSILEADEIMEEDEMEEEEIASLAIWRNPGSSARASYSVIYYTVEDDYYDRMRINEYHIFSQKTMEIYSSSYPKMEYVYPYKGRLYGLGENRIYSVSRDNTFEPLINEEVSPSFCIMDNKVYYLNNIKSDSYLLRSYHIYSGTQEDICEIPKNKEEQVNILGATKTFLLLRVGKQVYIINKINGEIEVWTPYSSNSVKLSWNEADCIYMQLEDKSIIKINLVSGEETVIASSDDWMAIFGNNIDDFAFLGNDLYVLYKHVVYRVDVANKSAQEIMGNGDYIWVDKEYLLISGSSDADMYYMQFGIPLYYYKPESGVVIIE